MALFLQGYCTARALCSVVVLCQNTIIFHWDILWISINICRLFTFSAMFVVFCFISGALWPDCWRFLVIKAGNQIPFFFYWSENSCWMQLFSYSGCNDVVKRHAFFLCDLLTFIRLNYWLITLEFLIFSLKLKQCFFISPNRRNPYWYYQMNNMNNMRVLQKCVFIFLQERNLTLNIKLSRTHTHSVRLHRQPTGGRW